MTERPKNWEFDGTPEAIAHRRYLAELIKIRVELALRGFTRQQIAEMTNPPN